MTTGRNDVPALFASRRLHCGQNIAATLRAAHYSFAAPQNVIDFLQRFTFPERRDAIPIEPRHNLGDLP